MRAKKIIKTARERKLMAPYKVTVVKNVVFIKRKTKLSGVFPNVIAMLSTEDCPPKNLRKHGPGVICLV